MEGDKKSAVVSDDSEKEIDETSFSYKLRLCDECTDKTRAYRLNVKDVAKTYHENS